MTAPNRRTNVLGNLSSSHRQRTSIVESTPYRFFSRLWSHGLLPIAEPPSGVGLVEPDNTDRATDIFDHTFGHRHLTLPTLFCFEVCNARTDCGIFTIT